MACFPAVGCDPRDSLGQGFHRSQSVVIAQNLGRKRPHITQRHRTKAFGSAAGNAFNNRIHIENRDAVDGHSAKLERGSIVEVFVTERNLANTDASGFCGHEGLSSYNRKISILFKKPMEGWPLNYWL